MDEAALAGLRVRVREGEAVAGIGIAVVALEDRHRVVVRAVLHMHDTADAGRVVRPIRLELSAAKGLLKGLLLVHQLVNRVGLVAVGDDRLVAEHADRRVNNQARIRQLRRIKRLRADALTVRDEHAVAAIHASTHNKIGSHGTFSIR